jgi:hypothetical protein
MLDYDTMITSSAPVRSRNELNEIEHKRPGIAQNRGSGTLLPDDSEMSAIVRLGSIKELFPALVV